MVLNARPAFVDVLIVHWIISVLVILFWHSFMVWGIFFASRWCHSRNFYIFSFYFRTVFILFNSSNQDLCYEFSTDFTMFILHNIFQIISTFYYFLLVLLIKGGTTSDIKYFLNKLMRSFFEGLLFYFIFLNWGKIYIYWQESPISFISA